MTLTETNERKKNAYCFGIDYFLKKINYIGFDREVFITTEPLKKKKERERKSD